MLCCMDNGTCIRNYFSYTINALIFNLNPLNRNSSTTEIISGPKK